MSRTPLKNVFWPNIFVGASLSRNAGDAPKYDKIDAESSHAGKAPLRRDLEPKSYF